MDKNREIKRQMWKNNILGIVVILIIFLIIKLDLGKIMGKLLRLLFL